MTDAIVLAAAREMFDAKHGSTGAIVERIASDWGCSIATVWRRVNPVLASWRHRKTRSDAGASTLEETEAKLIGATWLQSYRANGKRLAKLQTILEMLRANDRIVAGRVDETTGEFLPLSAGQVSRQLKARGWHPDQLMQPTPKMQLASEHPNHVWQIDASLCVLYYLPRLRGLQVMSEAEFNKNKPRNIARIERDRVWRYVVVDHCSGAFYTEYVFGAESSRNISQCLINAMQDRGPDDPFHGVPRLLMMDKGSANLGSMFQNLCAALGIPTWTNAVGKPWGKGSVESHNNVIECEFESRLQFANVQSLEDLNRERQRWSSVFNATVPHSRHGMTRFDAWMQIGPHLVNAPSVARCMDLANSNIEERVVSPLQRISFKGCSYDVSGVPGRRIGEKLRVARNAFGNEHSAQVLGYDEDGHEVWCRLEPIEFNQFGFAGDAVRIGEEFRTAPETDVDAHRKEAERIVMGAQTDEEAAANRKAGMRPFNGALDPFKAIADAPRIAHLPRKGTPAQIDAPRTIEAPPAPLSMNPPREFPPVGQAEACKRLKPMVEKRGGTWSAWCWNRVAERYPHGVPFDAFETFATELAQATRFRVVDNTLPRAAGGDA